VNILTKNEYLEMKRKRVNKKNKRIRYLIVILFIIVTAFYYYKPVKGYFVSSKILASKEQKLSTEQRKTAEMQAKIAYLNTEEGSRYIAKLNGFIEPGEVLIQLADPPVSVDSNISSKDKKSSKKGFWLFGSKNKVQAVACKKHTINGNPTPDPKCDECQKINQSNIQKEDVKNKEYKDKIVIPQEIINNKHITDGKKDKKNQA